MDTVRRENLSGESQGEREEFRPEETKDDAETQKDFWSVQGDFIYRDNIEPRIQLYVPKEESFPIPLKYIDGIRSAHTDLDSKKNELMTTGMSTEIEICQIRGQVSWDSEYWTKLLQKDLCGPGVETDKNPNDITSRSRMAWRLDKNWKSRSEKRKTRMGSRETDTRTRQKIEMSLVYWSEWWRVQRHH